MVISYLSYLNKNEKITKKREAEVNSQVYSLSWEEHIAALRIKAAKAREEYNLKLGIQLNKVIVDDFNSDDESYNSDDTF